MEGVFHPQFGDVDLEGPRDECGDEIVASAECGVEAKLFLNSGERGVMPQAGCNLSAVLDHNQMKVLETLLEYEVVCLPYLLQEGTEGEPSIGESRLSEGGVCAVLLAVFVGLGLLYVGGDGGAPGGSIGHHYKRIFLV